MKPKSAINKMIPVSLILLAILFQSSISKTTSSETPQITKKSIPHSTEQNSHPTDTKNSHESTEHTSPQTSQPNTSSNSLQPIMGPTPFK